jgi:DNA-binding PadR family transcriptional regulator
MTMSNSGDCLTLDLDTCPCGGNTLDKLIQPALLAVLAEETAHGYRLAERLGELPICGGQKPDLSGIYRALKSMEAAGLVVASWDLSDTGPAKRLFRITPAGRQCLTHWIDTLQQYRKHINALLKTVRKAAAHDC